MSILKIEIIYDIVDSSAYIVGIYWRLSGFEFTELFCISYHSDSCFMQRRFVVCDVLLEFCVRLYLEAFDFVLFHSGNQRVESKSSASILFGRQIRSHIIEFVYSSIFLHSEFVLFDSFFVLLTVDF